ncbi:MAG: recombinase family protein [Novosphingobium sp.]|uniref:recombinase family protein n=1 Tax=Novosphingobium sp. TaxID=1874826 RepID=UPI0032BCD350
MTKPLRCAVYTRKSTEDGLEQEFNSLDAQREACEAYILSQRHEGWTFVPGSYDDGGFSGGNMERPGLKALMAMIDEGQIDVIVVYKVDRLTRSLADFAKIVERLDAKQASFVSVTQAFNTTTSMGRLTLNVLLSFAQFEREVTGERIRDKIAASKKKGIWMGGPVPLGYQVIERKLVPVPEEAVRIRAIMRRYLEIRTAPALIEALRAEGVVTKIQQRASGPHRGGVPFARGSLFHLLKNPVYRGKIVHKGKAYDGEHEAIVDEDLWERVQLQLAAKAPPRKRPKNDRNQALLGGIITDPEGRPVVPTYATKGTRRYSFYETRKDLARPGDPPATRFQQGALDRHLISCITELLADEHDLRHLADVTDANQLRIIFDQARRFLEWLNQPFETHRAIRSIVQSVKICRDDIEVMIEPSAFGVAMHANWTQNFPRPERRPFREAKLRIDAASPNRASDQQLTQLLCDAFEVQGLVLASPQLSLNQIAKGAGRCRKQLAKLFNVSWLSPRIVEAIFDGTQPRAINRTRLLTTQLPIGWEEQEALFGLSN